MPSNQNSAFSSTTRSVRTLHNPSLLATACHSPTACTAAWTHSRWTQCQHLRQESGSAKFLINARTLTGLAATTPRAGTRRRPGSTTSCAVRLDVFVHKVAREHASRHVHVQALARAASTQNGRVRVQTPSARGRASRARRGPSTASSAASAAVKLGLFGVSLGCCC